MKIFKATRKYESWLRAALDIFEDDLALKAQLLAQDPFVFLRGTFEALLEIDPSAHYAHFALGQSLKQLGRTKEARTHLRLAVALSPETELYAGALARLGPAPATDRE